eukprot:g6857.t1
MAAQLAVARNSPFLNVKDFLDPLFTCKENAIYRAVPDELHPRLIFAKKFYDRYRAPHDNLHVHLSDNTYPIGRVLWSARYPWTPVVRPSENPML